MSKVIRSPRARVWRALTSPDELIRWDARLLSLEEPAPDYPAPGSHTVWRCLVGSVPVELRGDPVEVIPATRLRSAMRLGAFRFEETWTLVDDEPGATRLSLRLASENSVPLVGGELDRFDVRRLSTERVDETLSRLQEWCERDAAS